MSLLCTKKNDFASFLCVKETRAMEERTAKSALSPGSSTTASAENSAAATAAESPRGAEPKQGRHLGPRTQLTQQKLDLIRREYAPDSCNHCAKAHGSLKRCTGCKIAHYCSKECQAKDWQRRHKSHYKQVRKLLSENGAEPGSFSDRISKAGKRFGVRKVRSTPIDRDAVVYYPRMCLLDTCQILIGCYSVIPEYHALTFLDAEGGYQRERALHYNGYDSPISVCVCETDEANIIVVSVLYMDEQRDITSHRVEMFSDFPQKKLPFYTYRDQDKSRRLQDLHFFDGKLLVSSWGTILEFHIDVASLQPTGHQIPVGSDVSKVRSMCGLMWQETKAVVAQYEDKRGYYTVSCVAFTGTKLWQLGGLNGAQLDGTLFLPDDVCTDEKGHIFAADPASMRVVVIFDDLKMQTLFRAPGRV